MSNSQNLKLVLTSELATTTSYRDDPGEHFQLNASKIETLSIYRKIASIAERKSVKATHESQHLKTYGPLKGLHYGGGETLISRETLTLIAMTAGALAALLKAVGPIIVELLKRESSAEISVKLGDKHVRIKGSSDVEKALKVLKKLQNEFPDQDQSKSSTRKSLKPKKKSAKKK